MTTERRYAPLKRGFFPENDYTVSGNWHFTGEVTLDNAIGVFQPGPHGHSADEITSGQFADERIASSSVTQYQAALSIDWSQLTNVPPQGTVAWGDITGKPSFFTPAPHTHDLGTDVYGELADFYLSDNVALLDRDDQTWTGDNIFRGIVYLNPDPQTIPAAAVNADARLVLADNTSISIEQLSIGSSLSLGYRFVSATGDFTTPTAVSTSINYMAFIGAGGFDGTNWQTGSSALFGIRPDGTWSGTSRPTRATIEATQVDSVTRTLVATFKPGTGGTQFDNASVVITSASGATDNGWTLNLANANPGIAWRETDGATNNKNWDMRVSSERFIAAIWNDAYSSNTTWLAVDRTDTTVDEIELNAALLDFNGELDLSGSLTLGGSVRISSTGPTLRLTETDAASNNQVWDFFASNERLNFRVVNDAISSATSWMLVDRTANAIDLIQLNASSGEVELNATTLDFNGTAEFSGSVGVGTTPSRALHVVNSAAWIRLEESDAGTDEKIWLMGQSGGGPAAGFQIFARNDADNAGTQALQILRTGTTINEIQLDATLLDFNATTLDVSGQLIAGSANGTSNPLQLHANDDVGDVYLSFHQETSDTRKGYIGYGATGSDQFQIINEVNNAAMSLQTTGSSSSMTLSTPTIFVSTAAANVTIGHSSVLFSGLSVVGTSSSSFISTARYSNDANPATIQLSKSRNNTIGSHTVVQSGDALGRLAGYGSDGTNYINAAGIDFICDGTPGTNDMPGAIIFYTTPDGSTTLTERGRIDNTGAWRIGANSATPTHRLNTNSATTVGAAGGASALPATPTGYVIININGTDRKIPYYAT